MPSLSRELRRLLERTIAGKDGARQIAEDGAEQSLQRLAVDRPEAHSALTPEEKKLRSELRAHGRQLGDKLDPHRGSQTISHLKQAVAYEHWHRLLFARFLAENDLLMHPEHGVALSLDEVKELALGSGRDWIELAAEYAQRMLLREVFRSDDPALRVPLSPEKRRDLEVKLNSLPRELFLADDSLGWVYQFWQEDAKDAVNLSEVKIGADELSPVTQLFTEDYMVLFLLENTLGAWCTARRGSPDLPGYAWTYLRLNEDGTPAAGSYEGWPNSAKELKVLDPCMGSGHFLTFALPILARMRETEEGLQLTEAIAAVLRDNIFGLELDPRCSQIAAFNLALTAWKLAGSHFDLPPLNLACSGLGINASSEDWKALSGTDERRRELMGHLYSLFRNGPVLGSLIDPKRTGMGLIDVEIAEMMSGIEQALVAEQNTDDGRELAVAAKGTLAAFRILTSEFTLVATNVPYLGRNKQDVLLQEYCDMHYPRSKADLGVCFLERCLTFCSPNGTAALVTPHAWLYLDRYKELRRYVLTAQVLCFAARLGTRAFETITGEVVNVSLVGLNRQTPDGDPTLLAIDASEATSPLEKATFIECEPFLKINQKSQLKNPDARIVFKDDGKSAAPTSLLSNYAECYQGLRTGDGNRFIRCFWEQLGFGEEWEFFQSTSDEVSGQVSGLSYAIFWQQGDGQLRDYAAETRDKLHDMHESGNRSWGKLGIAVGQMTLRATRYFGQKFDNSLAVITPLRSEDLSAIWAYCTSSEYAANVRQIAHGIYFTNQTLLKVPFDPSLWRTLNSNSEPLPAPESIDPTQWIFDGRPDNSSYPLQVAVARLVGFRWPRQAGFNFPDCPALRPDELERLECADGIACLSSVAGEENAGTRLRAVLQTAFGASYNLAEMLAGKKATTLEDWLRDEFFEEHCHVFQQTPFIWHIWDGLKDGFHALVNYHKLDHRNLEKLIFSYLGDWLARQRQDVQNGVEGADTRLAAAEALQGELKKILEGEEPYDIFVRWKPLDKQPVGWNPDLNDGVRMNIRPWITEAKLYKATKPGILRVTPNIKYTKDRGKEPARDPKEFPWFAKSTERINDAHLSLDEKRRARGLK
jgi:hypothetical protein